jgi:hypothetical protein
MERYIEPGSEKAWRLEENKKVRMSGEGRKGTDKKYVMT